MAGKTYALDHTRLMVVGGDGNAWVRQSFNMLNLPQTHLLDRFHMVRALRQSFGRELNTSDLCKRLFSEGFDVISGDLLNCIRFATGKRKEQMRKTYQYLQNNQDALVDLDKRGFSDF